MWGWVSLADAVFALKSPIQIFTWDFSFYCIVLLRASLKLSLGAGFFSLRCRVGHSNLWTRISCFCGGFPELWPCRSQFSGYLHASIESPFLALMLVFQCCRIPFSEEFSGKCLSDGFLGFPWCPVYRFGIFFEGIYFHRTWDALHIESRHSKFCRFLIWLNFTIAILVWCLWRHHPFQWKRQQLWTSLVWKMRKPRIPTMNTFLRIWRRPVQWPNRMLWDFSGNSPQRDHWSTAESPARI